MDNFDRELSKRQMKLQESYNSMIGELSSKKSSKKPSEIDLPRQIDSPIKRHDLPLQATPPNSTILADLLAKEKEIEIKSTQILILKEQLNDSHKTIEEQQKTIDILKEKSKTMDAKYDQILKERIKNLEDKYANMLRDYITKNQEGFEEIKATYLNKIENLRAENASLNQIICKETPKLEDHITKIQSKNQKKINSWKDKAKILAGKYYEVIRNMRISYNKLKDTVRSLNDYCLQEMQSAIIELEGTFTYKIEELKRKIDCLEN